MKTTRRIAAVMAAGMFLLGCEGGDDNASGTTSPPRSSGTETAVTSTTEEATPVTEATELESAAFTFSFEDGQGYTFDVAISGIRSTTDVTQAPPGETQLLVEFDYRISNTSSGRTIPHVDLLLAAAYPGDCAGGYCDDFVAPFPATAIGQVVSIPSGGSETGRFSYNAIDPSNRGTYFVTVPESTPADQVFYGFPTSDCQGYCWFSPSGQAVPDGLPDLPDR